MSRNQWILITALGLAVLLVFGCFGGYLLLYLTGGFGTQDLVPDQAIDTPTPTPTPTRSPEDIMRRTISVSDAEFLDCSKAIVNDISTVYHVGLEVVDTGDPATARLLASRAFEVLTILDNCREPTDPTLLEGKELLGVGLDDIVTAGAMLADGNPSGYEFLAEASATINGGLLLLTAYMNAQSPQPAPTSTPARSGGMDEGYLQCLRAIVPAVSLLCSDVAGVCDTGNFTLVCQSYTAWDQRIGQLQRQHTGCPMPADHHLLRPRLLVGRALGDTAESIEAIELFCPGGDVSWLYVALERMVEVHELMTQANAELAIYLP